MKYFFYTIIANSIAFAKSADPGIISIEHSIQEDFLRLLEDAEEFSRCPKTFQAKINYKDQNIYFDWDLNSGISGHLSKNRNGLKINLTNKF